jgi:hypothetical protein
VYCRTRSISSDPRIYGSAWATRLRCFPSPNGKWQMADPHTVLYGIQNLSVHDLSRLCVTLQYQHHLIATMIKAAHASYCFNNHSRWCRILILALHREGYMIWSCFQHDIGERLHTHWRFLNHARLRNDYTYRLVCNQIVCLFSRFPNPSLVSFLAFGQNGCRWRKQTSEGIRCRSRTMRFIGIFALNQFGSRRVKESNSRALARI